ncbi:uncharacterized protein LOC133182511 [Saccostrea echinata]|uniref:uncharacterized protein LOC133182511 n=1 Tax=Saccostrea echinata TaxID=191078 RepID=UPI002A822A1D|nr:uncharacterized protein LOC133182511 [Saccostrea echinata]
MNVTEESATSERGSVAEIFLPPLGLFLGGAIALTLLAICTSHSCRHLRPRSLACVGPSLSKSSFTSFTSLLSNPGANSQSQSQSSFADLNGFYTKSDAEILEHLQLYQNNPRYLYKIAIPAVTSLIFCPMIMIAYKPIANFLWPDRTQPAINEAIACFLAPAGMVYAVSFGFAFQQVLQKQIDITARLNNDFSEMELLMNLTKKLSCLKSTTRMKMYIALKEEIMTVVQYITEVPELENNKNGAIWDILDSLREAPVQRHKVDTAIINKIIKYVGKLNSVVDKVGTLHAKIHPLQWAFLEILGYSSFLGILMVKCESYRMEMCMSFVTCLSISMSCYIVADIDNPFHGFFRINIKSVLTILEQLEKCYNDELHCEIQLQNITGNK